MVVLNIITILLCVAILAGLTNLIQSKPKTSKSVAIKRCMKRGYAVISLANNGKMFNFLLDSASNVSHLCSEYVKDLHGIIRKELDDEIVGFNGTSKRTEYCIANFNDIMHNEYTVALSISDTLSAALKGFEKDSKVIIHGLLGTPFLKSCGYSIDYETLRICPKS